MSLESKQFFNRLQIIQGVIFKGYTLKLRQLKQLLIELIHQAVVQLDCHISLSVTTDDLFEAAKWLEMWAVHASNLTG